MSIIQKKLFLILALVLLAGCGSPQLPDQATSQITTDEARAIAKEAYILVLSHLGEIAVFIQASLLPGRTYPASA